MSVPSLIHALIACTGAPPVTPTPAPEPAPSSAPAPDAGAALFAQASNAFAFDLWARLQADQPAGANVVVSPASLSLALAMTATGAAGETAAQMGAVLHAPDLDAFTGSAAAQLAAWSAAGSGVELHVANRLFGAQGTPFEPAFLQGLADRFGAPLEPLDFVGAPDPARVRINGWIAEQTAGRIPELLPPGSVDGDTRLVLANAIAFDGQWASAFDAENTTPAPFRAAGGEVEAQMMHQTGTFGYAVRDGVAVLELPYAGDRVVMDFVLPAEGGDPGAVDAATLDGWLAALEPTQVQVTLPRLDLRPPSADLAEPLGALGMPLAFGGGDFSGMTRAEPLRIDAVQHQAMVVVDEQGTQAAAATGVVMTREVAVAPPSFVADRPFLFLIRDRSSGAILFLGEVATPAG